MISNKTLILLITAILSVILAARYDVQGTIGVVSGLIAGSSSLWLFMDFVDNSSK
jgi:hypothetical protein